MDYLLESFEDVFGVPFPYTDEEIEQAKKEHCAVLTEATGPVVNSHQAECPECGKIGQYRAMKRWHFDNCHKPNDNGWKGRKHSKEARAKQSANRLANPMKKDKITGRFSKING